MKRPEFTEEQESWICYHIGEWYFYWQHRLCNHENKTHKLGYAKEMLKAILCDDKEFFIDENTLKGESDE
jgi:hypothetical protein